MITPGVPETEHETVLVPHTAPLGNPLAGDFLSLASVLGP